MSARGAALSRDDAARLVASLRAFAPSDVGSAAWWQQRRAVERLNSGAHASDGGGDASSCAACVAAAFAEQPAQLDCFVRELLLAEAWRERVAPHLASGADAPRLCLYFSLYHEAVAANLLERLALHGGLCDAAGEDALAELADYAVRAALFLTTDAGSKPAPHEQSPRALIDAAEGAELLSGARDARLGAALSGLSVLRALAQRGSAGLPPAVRSRLLRAADAPAALARALAVRPWARRLGARAQVFAGGAWQDEPPAAALAPADAQAWLALLALLADAEDDAYPAANRARVLSAARRVLTPQIVDALPALQWLQRAAEQAELMPPAAPAAGAPGAAARSMLLLEAVPPWRDALLARTRWDDVISAAAAGVFGDTPAAAQAAQREAAAAAALWEEALVLPPEDAEDGDKDNDNGISSATTVSKAGKSASKPGLPASVRVFFQRRDGAGGWAPAWEAVLSADAAAPPADVALTAPSGAAVRGARWRLLPPAAPRRVPPAARLRCSLGAAEAALELPPTTGDGTLDDVAAQAAWEAAPPVIWATLGALARDGFALQLRLARVDAPRAAAVDGDTGRLMLYRLAGGALTLRSEETA